MTRSRPLQMTRGMKMKITKLKIKNFRGIRESEISFPTDASLVCLIGAGDSTKTTILNAIEWLLWPNWSLVATDNDFYNCDVTNAIVIEGTFTEIPDKLKSEDKFGLFLRNDSFVLENESASSQQQSDEPLDGQNIFLSIRLTIDEYLEPKWEVICNTDRNEPKLISSADRRLFASGRVGINCEKDLGWGKYSILQKHIDSKNELQNTYAQQIRVATSTLKLDSLDAISKDIISIRNDYGVNIGENIHNKLMLQSSKLSSALCLYDDNSPLKQKGFGTQRLISIGLNIENSTTGTLLLIDEIETGLEPYRIVNLIATLHDKTKTDGQVILTTHSPVVVTECDIREMYIIQSHNGLTEAKALKQNNKGLDDVFQKELRRNPSSFLSKRVIVCEGKTECGILRAFDNEVLKKRGKSLALFGVSIALGNGNELAPCADTLNKLGYDAAILMDSDDIKTEEDVQKININQNIKTFRWEEGHAIEDQIFEDISIDKANTLLKVAVEEKGYLTIKGELNFAKITYQCDDERRLISISDEENKKKLGEIAKNKSNSWFKRIDLGEEIGNIIFEGWEEMSNETILKQVFENIGVWVSNNG